MSATRLARTLAIVAVLAVSTSAGLSQPQPVPVEPIPPKTEPIKLLPAIPAQKGPEATRIHILLVLDTDDQMGATWGRDGENMKALLEADLRKQQLEGRYSIEIFTGKKVSPENILAYYRALRTGPGEALVFYYSGHGGFHLNKGHFLALHYGKLFRKDLIDAMATFQPRLRVVLTDCCSNFAGGAFAAEPTGGVVNAIVLANSMAQPKARFQEPPPLRISPLVPIAGRVNAPARPTNTVNPYQPRKARNEEPRGITAAITSNNIPARPKAKLEEPLVTANGAITSSLATHKGTTSLREIIDGSDGEVLRHLLYRHAGLVDINGCTKGGFSFGTLEWGGSLFTNCLIALQKNKLAEIDANGNRVVEWSEFFPHLQKSTLDAGARIPRGKVRQVPEASQLAAPVVP